MLLAGFKLKIPDKCEDYMNMANENKNRGFRHGLNVVPNLSLILLPNHSCIDQKSRPPI